MEELPHGNSNRRTVLCSSYINTSPKFLHHVLSVYMATGLPVPLEEDCTAPPPPPVASDNGGIYCKSNPTHFLWNSRHGWRTEWWPKFAAIPRHKLERLLDPQHTAVAMSSVAAGEYSLYILVL